ncbi:hypothetical protein F2P81_018396 [Scophthalmus maximus]|uniref:Uncharacterized protein n=1 Tax=Scophthalmus maximus TaxID=52904 RepID=A0A6A4SDU5_SCOMX|nr:hypothetical protein F2P81_018396 [Scophthalmus maximus]
MTAQKHVHLPFTIVGLLNVKLIKSLKHAFISQRSRHVARERISRSEITSVENREDIEGIWALGFHNPDPFLTTEET